MAAYRQIENYLPYDQQDQFSDSSEYFASAHDSTSEAEPEQEFDQVIYDRIPPPPTDQQYDTVDDAMTEIHDFTKTCGYALAKRRSKKNRAGLLVNVTLVCNRGRVYVSKVPEENRKRQTNTRRIGCPFSASLKRSSITNTWYLEVHNSNHNHEPSPISTHPTLRRLLLQEHAEEVTNQLQVGTRPALVLTTLRQADPNLNLKRRDIYNHRASLRREFLDGKTPIQALLSQIPAESGWIFNYEAVDDVVTAVYCVHETSLKLLQASHYVLLMDCTYKTNKFGMPLLDIVGVSPTNKTFFVGFGFLRGESEQDYMFILQNLRATYRRLELPDPRTILTDREKALMNAIGKVFPGTYCMLCIWHVNKNILAKSRGYFRRDLIGQMDDDEDDEVHLNFDEQVKIKEKALMRLWTEIVDAPSEVLKDVALEKFRKEYNLPLYRPLVAYIEQEWLNADTERRLLRCYTNRYLHFGNQATSRAESEHWCLKRDLNVSTNDMLTVLQSFEHTVISQHANIQQAVADSKIREPIRHAVFLFSRVARKISTVALDKVAHIRDKHLPRGRGKEPIGNCTGTTFQSLGIPCIHTIEHHLESQVPLGLAQFHAFWHLTPPEQLPQIDPTLLLLEPRIVRTRGRPAGAINQPPNRDARSVHREPSMFERVLGEGRGAQRRRGRGRGRAGEDGRAGVSIPSEMLNVFEM